MSGHIKASAACARGGALTMQSGEWSTGLLSGGDPCTVGVDCCFPCVGFGRNVRRAGLVHSCLAPMLWQCAFFGGGVALVMNQTGGLAAIGAGAGLVGLAACQRGCFRQQVSERWLPEGGGENVCSSICIELACHGCSLAQVHRELAKSKAHIVPQTTNSMGNSLMRSLGVMSSDDNMSY